MTQVDTPSTSENYFDINCLKTSVFFNLYSLEYSYENCDIMFHKTNSTNSKHNLDISKYLYDSYSSICSVKNLIYVSGQYIFVIRRLISVERQNNRYSFCLVLTRKIITVFISIY